MGYILNINGNCTPQRNYDLRVLARECGDIVESYKPIADRNSQSIEEYEGRDKGESDRNGDVTPRAGPSGPKIDDYREQRDIEEMRDLTQQRTGFTSNLVR